jgi:hypothetical protein
MYQRAYVLVLVIIVSMSAAPSYAYIGPGAGLGLIGSLIAVVALIAVTVLGLFILPLKLLFGRKQNKKKTKSPSQDN